MVLYILVRSHGVRIVLYYAHTLSIWSCIVYNTQSRCPCPHSPVLNKYGVRIVLHYADMVSTYCSQVLRRHCIRIVLYNADRYLVCIFLFYADMGLHSPVLYSNCVSILFTMLRADFLANTVTWSKTYFKYTVCQKQ